jgi:transposase-like protein
MEKVADHYGIPSINFGFEIADMVSNKQLIMSASTKEVEGVKVFSPDGVHPYLETGHIIYHNIWKRSFESMIPEKSAAMQKHRLPQPLAKDYFARTQMVDVKNVQLSTNWELLDLKQKSPFSGFGNYLQYIAKASQSGETLIVHFKGRAFGAYDVMGQDAGRVLVEVDGKVKDTIYRFDAYCTYRRMNYFIIDGLKNKKHKVVFRTLCEPFDKAAILAKRNQVIKNPEEYKQNNWYVGKILIDGVLIH